MDGDATIAELDDFALAEKIILIEMWRGRKHYHARYTTWNNTTPDEVRKLIATLTDMVDDWIKTEGKNEPCL